MQKYPRGRRGSPAKGVGCLKTPRGFKSLLLRQKSIPRPMDGGCFFRCIGRDLISERPLGARELRAPAAGGGCREPAISAAVEKCKGQRKPAAFFGHRKADSNPSFCAKKNPHQKVGVLFWPWRRDLNDVRKPHRRSFSTGSKTGRSLCFLPPSPERRKEMRANPSFCARIKGSNPL